jgi:hypothetical protein
MNITDFIAKWRKVELTERSAAQQHFLDLCDMFDQPKPAEADPAGTWFTFEKSATKHGGGRGWADVWKRNFFGWEYKGKHKNLQAAYDQLLRYRQSLENPPLLVVCDMERIIIHTNFTATVNRSYEIALAQLDQPDNIRIMRALFHNPEELRPETTVAAITTEVAQRLGEVAQNLRGRGLDATAVARFLDRIVFCLFAEDVGLLPQQLFSRIVEKARDPEHFSKLLAQLFEAMATGGATTQTHTALARCAIRASSLKTRPQPPNSPNARSQTSTTNAPLGSIWPTARSTWPSPPPTAGPQTLRPTKSSAACLRSTNNARSLNRL